MTASHTPLPSGVGRAPEPLIEAFERLRRNAPPDDPTLTPLLAAVERVVAHWERERDELDSVWCSYERLLDEEHRTRRGLAALLRTVSDLSERGGDGTPRAERLDAAPEGPTVAAPDVDLDIDLDVRMLGPFELRRRGRAVDGFHGPKTPRVLRYLFAHHGHTVPRDVLMDVFWSDATPESARRSLQQTIYLLRRGLRDPDAPDRTCIVYEREGYSIDPAVPLRCDTDELERAAADARRADAEGRRDLAADRYEAAVALYRGDFLEDLPYDDWTLTSRRHLRGLYLEGANRLAELWCDAGRVEDALEVSQRVLALDPCDEAAHRSAMRCYAALGHRGLVDRQFLACVADLERELGVTPTTETVELRERLTHDATR